MTTTSPDLEDLDVRSTIERILGGTVDPDEFSEAEMNAIDIAAVHVYKKARGVLPPDLLDTSPAGDPAAPVRQWAYEYAYSHPHDIHSRTSGQIVNHVRGRLRQRFKRLLDQRLERPYSIGDDFDARVRHYWKTAQAKAAKKGILEPRKYPVKYRQDKGPLESIATLEMIGLYGRFIPEDQQQFIITGYRDGAPVRESRAVMDRLHTRRPSRAEYWAEVLDGNSHRTARKDLAADTELHADTIAAIVEDVAPAVSERFSTGPRPVDGEDVDRKRLRLVSEEVQRVLLEKFDVLYEE